MIYNAFTIKQETDNPFKGYWKVTSVHDKNEKKIFCVDLQSAIEVRTALDLLNAKRITDATR